MSNNNKRPEVKKSKKPTGKNQASLKLSNGVKKVQNFKIQGSVGERYIKPEKKKGTVV